MSNSAPLGSPVSAEYDPMRTACWWVVSAHAGSWRIQWGCADELSAPWPTGDGSAPETRSHRKPSGYIAAGLKRSHVSLAELSDEQCCLVDFIYRRLWVSDRRCALA